LKAQDGFGTVDFMSTSGRRKEATPDGPAPERVQPAWHAWLQALASDAEAALGAAFAYETLDGRARTAVIDVLEKDAERLDVPRVAVFAPLLSVERDETRRERIQQAMGDDVGPGPERPARARMGAAKNGDQVVVAETHVYLDFVRLTICRLDPDRCVRWVQCEPLVHAEDAKQSEFPPDDVALEAVPMGVAIDAIARAIVAQRRRDGELPETLRPLVELFDADLCEASDDILEE